MKRYFKITLTVLMMFTFLGCNSNTASHTLSNAIDSALVATSGNKPPQRFVFDSPYRANGYVMQHKDYSFTMPLTKERDWGKMTGWYGSSDFQGIGIAISDPNANIGITLGYGINFSSYISKYTERERAIENGTKKYSSQRKTPNGKTININVHTEYHGTENYPCVVAGSYDKKRGVKAKTYRCYKFNPEKTMYKSVTTKLIYTKSPNLPTKYRSLANEYTYRDLQKRAKRVLDSLHIKDGW